jgi:hypothetical protein
MLPLRACVTTIFTAYFYFTSTQRGVRWLYVSYGMWVVLRFRLALSKGPNKVGVSLFSPEVIEVSSFWGISQSRCLLALTWSDWGELFLRDPTEYVSPFSHLKWLRWALSEAPNRVGVSLTSPEVTEMSSFWGTQQSRCLPYLTGSDWGELFLGDPTEYVSPFSHLKRLRWALSEAPNRVGVSLSSTEVIEVSSFWETQQSDWLPFLTWNDWG